jgi:hypothetical protein
MYYAEGKVTGGGPKDKAEREALYRTGWQPYSIKVGDKYYSYGRLEPLGTVMGLTADFLEIIDTMSGGEREDVAAKAAFAIAQNITNKTFMRGLSDAVNAVSDPVRYGESWTERFVGTVVPRGVAAVTRSIDPTLRRPESYVEVLKAQLPYLSETVLPKRNLWGEPVQLTKGGLAAFSPVKVTKETESKLDKEMVRLDVAIALPRAEVRGIELTPDEYDWLIKTSGRMAKQRLQAWVNSPGYDKTSDRGKTERITRTIFKTRDAQREKLYGRIRKRGKAQ